MADRRRLVLVGGVVLLLGGLASSFGAAWFLSHRKAPRAPEAPLVIRGQAPEELRLTAQDGLRFGASQYAQADADCAVVLVHGNGSRRAGVRVLTEEVLAAGCHALPITVRAHGDSDGELNDFGYSARLDVVAAVGHLEARFPEARRYVLGVSLGSAAAIFASAQLGDRVQGFLLESPYQSLEIATRNRIRMVLPAALEDIAYLGLMMWADRILTVPVHEIAPARAAAGLSEHADVLVLAGTKDVHATLDEAKAVLRAAPHARLEIFEGAAHDELYDTDPARYRALIRAWLAPPRAAPPPPPAPAGEAAGAPPSPPPAPAPTDPRSAAP